MRTSDHRSRRARILALLLPLALAVARSPGTWANSDVDEVTEKVLEQLEHGQHAFEYAAAVLEDYQSGTTIAKWSPINTEAEVYVAAAEQSILVFDALAYAPLAQFPGLLDPVSSDFPAYRSSLHALTQALDSEVGQYLASADLLDRLRYCGRYCEQLDQVVIKLTAFLGHLYDNFSLLPYVEEYIGLRWVDYELAVKPATSRLRNSVKAAIARLAAAHEKRREDLERGVSNTQLLIAEEAARLGALAAQVEQTRLKLEAMAAALQAKYASVTKLEGDLSQSDALLQQLRARLNAETIAVENARATLNSLNGSIALKEAEYAVPFESSPWKCPNGTAYANCTHAANKVNYNNNRSRLASELASLRAKRDSTNMDLGAAVQRRAQASAALSNEQAHRAQVDATLAAARTEYARDAEIYRLALIEYMRDSRLTERLTAESGNASDASTLASLSQSLTP